MLNKPLLYLRLFFWAVRILAGDAQRSLKAAWTRRQALLLGSSAPEARDRNIVIVGANFAGYHAAKLLCTALSPHSRYRVVVVEPNSHFQFTWVLPRFCVAPGHEDKAFVPYGGNVAGAPEGALRWVRDRVVEVTRTGVRLRDSDEEIPYDYLVIATGAQVKDGLPTRVNAEDKREGMKLLQAMQARIEAATRVVVVGGGAAGVELATDVQCKYPEKKVTLIHSRGALMHRFGKGLQEASLAAMEKLGGEVILNERVVGEDAGAGTVTLQSGRVIECDCFINATGQKPASDVLAKLAPGAISSTGHIKVKPTLQLADDTLPNIYVCGDVTDTNVPNPNSRSATRQASIVADNLLLEARGKPPRYTYEPSWSEGGILLTLGLYEGMMHWGDGKTELNRPYKEGHEELMAARAWTGLGEKPYEDPYMKVAEDVESQVKGVA
ncbi:hypothetical protein S7711_03078 [Stachybotrys chartarum IBT 7711]|uniref:FAD/NAD(P)-binding domain-containing protein n=1 Tax=Stachybotrys chartarum (strain CBS 109288 / IBT 7711) TaxID=1280523 RepID=A0A084B891_STACB|nr:hypothetical protein S7711_03078 [Stachybotrys chartarum IBT 7711]KFA54088.1 hypothetical protein S40293_05546 [Stachybotrys chartarum IBT 40293]KFA76150.1 hypothetical protein S40288_04111 [Stachybotrys chartarum IBT 40288]